MIVAIEGGDAAGKYTQSTRLAEKLGAKRFAFPNYESATGKAILGNLKSEWATHIRCGQSEENVELRIIRDASENKLNAMVLQSLFLANRMEAQETLQAAADCGHVVFDRYTASGEIYGTLDGLDPEWLRAMNDALIVQPDLFILLDASVDEGFRRRPERRDRYESDRERLEQVRLAYLRLFTERQARTVKEGLGQSWVVVDAVATADEVEARIWAVVEPKLNRSIEVTAP